MCSAIYTLCYTQYLNREPIYLELEAITDTYANDGFPGRMGAVDCIHLHWKNFPKAYKGQCHNQKDGKLATISCEAVCDKRLYCWSWFSGRCGTNNDITVLDHSPLFIDILNGRRKMTLPNGYYFNRQRRHWFLYLLADGIYPNWYIFVKPIHTPINDIERDLTKRQEGRRKDIERMLGAIQSRFKILRHEIHE